MKHFKTTETATVNNYPYGSLRATVTFSLEWKAGKGFRTVFQSINPKNGRLNAPKKSTYYSVIVMKEEDNGHIGYSYFGFNGAEEINRSAPFMADHFDLFTPAQIKDIYAETLQYIKATMYATVAYRGADVEMGKPILSSAVDAAVKGLKEGTNEFSNIKIDIAALDACEKKDYQPFKMVSTGPISLSSMMAHN